MAHRHSSPAHSAARALPFASAAALAMALAVAPGCSCEGGEWRTAPGLDMDAGSRDDTGGGGGGGDTGGGGSQDTNSASTDVWPNPNDDADLDAWFDPTLVDANLIDANRDVGPIDPLLGDASTPGTGGDSGRVRDAGGDARTPAGACGVLWFRGAPVPIECLPRCRASTRDLFEACSGDGVCEATATTMDLAPFAQMFIWEEFEFSELDCSSCVGTMRFSCWHEPCPLQSEAWVDCVSTRGSVACERDRGILDRCLAPFAASVDACSRLRVRGCFPPF